MYTNDFDVNIRKCNTVSSSDTSSVFSVLEFTWFCVSGMGEGHVLSLKCTLFL